MLDYRIMVTYLEEQISLGKAAQQLGTTRFELIERFQGLGIPIHLGPRSMEDARAEIEVTRKLRGL